MSKKIQIEDTRNRPFDVSIIVPFLDEYENLEQLYKEVTSIMSSLKKTYEIIFIDDGSKDQSDKKVLGFIEQDDRIKLIQFTRNFGQTAAMAAGFEHAQGRIYITIDADNQNVPSDIPKLLAKIEEGYDVVSGWRKDRKDKFVTRRIPSVTANWIISRITGVRLRDYGCTLKAYKAEFIDSVTLYGEMHRFIPAYASMVGAKVTEIPVDHRPRTKGRTKYSLNRIFKVLMDLLTVKFLSSYATKPGYLFGAVGALLCSGGVLAGIEVIIEKYVKGTWAHNNPMLLLAIFLFILGIQIILIGLIAELLVRTYHESQGKRPFLIKKTFNL
ncbi:MAG: glycosyltransferase [Deltaproteobacteria bacterium CG07_land_8_20_14_0_80_38_7]|nr:MAG: glycosyltransferase [Deltaproteobacteria bacterium CG07_land_8_20_14_0_80_38_7]